MNRLKPCPFCGHDALLSQDPMGCRQVNGKTVYRYEYKIICTSVECRAHLGWFADMEEAITAWNNRIAPKEE